METPESIAQYQQSTVILKRLIDLERRVVDQDNRIGNLETLIEMASQPRPIYVCGETPCYYPDYCKRGAVNLTHEGFHGLERIKAEVRHD